MKILDDKSKANLEAANYYFEKENNISASRLYYSAFQESCVLLHKYHQAHTKQKQKDPESEAILKKIELALSKGGSHDKKIKALKIFIAKELGHPSDQAYESNIASLQGIREVADYRNRNVEKDEINSAFKSHEEIKKIFSKLI